MIFNILLFILGVIFTIIGITNIIIYLNLISIGYTFLEYVNFIIRRVECLSLILGIIILLISLFNRRKK